MNTADVEAARALCERTVQSARDSLEGFALLGDELPKDDPELRNVMDMAKLVLIIPALLDEVTALRDDNAAFKTRLVEALDIIEKYPEDYTTMATVLRAEHKACHELRTALETRAQNHDTLCDEIANAHAERIAQLTMALREALEIAEEGWSYAPDYFRDRWMDRTRLAALAELAR